MVTYADRLKSSPSPTDRNGRDRKGRFAAGNQAAKGNPHQKATQRFRATLMETVKPADFRAVVRKLVAKAKAGEPWAVKELLDRTVGRPVSADLIEQEEKPPYVVRVVNFADLEREREQQGDGEAADVP